MQEPMNIMEIYVAFIAALMGIAYPIMIEVNTRLYEKYHSHELVSKFKNEKYPQNFDYLLKVNLILIFIYILIVLVEFLFYVHIFSNDFYGENKNMCIEFRLILLFIIVITCTFLIFFFFRYAETILIYFDAMSLVNKIVDKSIKNKEGHHLPLIADLLIWAVKNEEKDILGKLLPRDENKRDRDEYKDNSDAVLAIKNSLILAIRTGNIPISQLLGERLYDLFLECREKACFDRDGYPQKYYDTVYEVTEEILSSLGRRSFVFLETMAAGGIWLLGEQEYHKIHRNTYEWMWSCLKLEVEAGRDDMVLSYWRTASQYFKFSMEPLEDVLTFDLYQQQQEEIAERHRERTEFLEFNYALGGLLLYKQRYQCIKKMFSYTLTIPPEYPLLPTTMAEVLKAYFELEKTKQEPLLTWSFKYPFPDAMGINADDVIREQMGSYFALLFWRQYAEFGFDGNALTSVVISDDVSECNQRKEYLASLEKQVNAIRENKELMDALGFDKLEYFTDEWCQQNNRSCPPDLFNGLKEELERNTLNTEIDAKPDADHIAKFQNSSKALFLPFLNKLEMLGNLGQSSEEVKIYSSRDMLVSKIYLTNQAYHGNFDTFLAQRFVGDMMEWIPRQFEQRAIKRYRIERDNLEAVVSNLQIDPNHFIFIAFDTENNRPYLNALRDKGYEFRFLGISSRFTDVLFLLRKEDLPTLLYNKLDKPVIDEYSYEEIGEGNIHLYAAVNDLNKKTALRGMAKKEYPNQDKAMETQAWLHLALPLEIKWKENVKIVRLEFHSVALRRGLPNYVEDVQPFDAD